MSENIPSAPVIRVLIVDDHPLARQGVRAMLMRPLRVPARTPSHQEEVARYGIPYWGAEDEDDAD